MSTETPASTLEMAVHSDSDSEAKANPAPNDNEAGQVRGHGFVRLANL